MYSFTRACCGIGPGAGGQTAGRTSIPEGHHGNPLQEAQQKADFGPSES